jgi:hypothetical protein
MNLYIEIKNGVTENHPAFESNLLQAFGQIPTHWEPFLRVERPIDPYKIVEAEEPVYAKVNGVWTDVWQVRDMSAEEKTAKQQGVIVAFNKREYASNWSAWALDETTCTMQPPIPRPAPVAGKDIRWCGADHNWKEVPARPEGQYKFDFLAWTWVAL